MLIYNAVSVEHKIATLSLNRSLSGTKAHYSNPSLIITDINPASALPQEYFNDSPKY